MRNKLILVVALVFGLVSAFLIYNYLNHVNQVAQNRQYTQVVTATQDIPANTTITNIMVELKPFPTELRNGKEIVDINTVVGKISSTAISKGEVLLENRLVKPGESSEQLSYAIPEGMRAMSIPVNEITGVANMIKKGDRVDILAALPAGTQSSVASSVVVLQNIEVLAVGTVLNPSSTPSAEKNAAPATITVAVDPQSAVKLKLALQNTSVSLSLRSAADKNVNALTPFFMNEF